MRLRYIADDRVCLALAGIRTVERIYAPGSSTHRLRVTYKGHSCEVGYPSLEALDATYTRLVAALTAQPEVLREGTP